MGENIKMREILIADVKSVNVCGKSPGHYFSVANNYIDIFRNSGFNIRVAGGPIYKGIFPEVETLPYDTYKGENVVKSKAKIIYNMRFLFKKNSVIILQSNAVATAYLGIALFASKKNPVYMIQYDTLGLDSLIKRCLYRLAYPKIAGMICTSETIGRAYKKPYCVVPDYIYTKDANLDERNTYQYDICMVGLICEDKGVLEAVEVLANTDYKVFVGGKVSNAALKKRIEDAAQNHGNITMKLGYLSDDEFRTAIASSKYCLLNYSNAYSEHSSGVVYDVLFSGTPIIARKCEFLNFIDEWEVGYVYTDISQFDFAKAMLDSSIKTARRNIIPYLESHKAFAESLCAFVVGDKIDGN